MKETIKEISHEKAWEFLKNKHYAGRKPSISKAFGLFENERLAAVCTFGKPASPTLCTSICGKEYSKNVYELNRLCRVDDYAGELSAFVSACLRMLKPMNWIVVSYSDTAMNHHGYIYQACNFMYTGCTKERTDRYTCEGKHPRHYDKNAVEVYRQVRSAKHRYVYFCTSSKPLKKKWKACLNYAIQPYPKGDNSYYLLGSVLKPKLIKVASRRLDEVEGVKDKMSM